MKILVMALALCLVGCATYEFKPAPAQKERLATHLEIFKDSVTHDIVQRANLKVALMDYMKKSNQFTYGNADRLEMTDGELIKLAEDLLK